MHITGTQITTTVFLKMISEVGISQGFKKKKKRERQTSESPLKMAPRKSGEDIRGQRMESYKGHLLRAEKENDKEVMSFKSPATLKIFEKLPLRKMPSSKEIQAKIRLAGGGERNRKQESESHAVSKDPA